MAANVLLSSGQRRRGDRMPPMASRVDLEVQVRPMFIVHAKADAEAEEEKRGRVPKKGEEMMQWNGAGSGTGPRIFSFL